MEIDGIEYFVKTFGGVGGSIAFMVYVYLRHKATKVELQILDENRKEHKANSQTLEKLMKIFCQTIDPLVSSFRTKAPPPYALVLAPSKYPPSDIWMMSRNRQSLLPVL